MVLVVQIQLFNVEQVGIEASLFFFISNLQTLKLISL